MQYLLIIVLCLQCWLLYQGQRKIFPLASNIFGLKAAFFLAAPGTVLHELSHYILCKLLSVATGRVSLFKPVVTDNGYTLGYVEHAKTDPFRQVFISIAPLLMVAPLLLLLTMLLFGSSVISDPTVIIEGANWWKIIIWIYITASAGQGAFPSTGDYIGPIGAFILLLTGVAVFFALPLQELLALVEILVAILLLPALASLISLLFLNHLSKRSTA